MSTFIAILAFILLTMYAVLTTYFLIEGKIGVGLAMWFGLWIASEIGNK